ncbi:MAG: HesA/MoeB/ThiF family protein [Chloroflexi bacterium]|nr:MAG: HesA/MoeB/ThiF family protein [Chloroflexota bacterium]
MTDARHHRQRIIAEVGEAGQQRLERAAVAIVGVGGLGSPVALYLAAAGVGRLGLIDDQDVERSNLNRQVIFEEGDVGRSKVEAAAGRLLLLDAGLRIDAHHENVRASNVAELFAQYDVVVDGTDAFETKFLLNDAAVLLRKPLVHGAVLRWGGQVTTVLPDAPCLRCLRRRKSSRCFSGWVIHSAAASFSTTGSWVRRGRRRFRAIPTARSAHRGRASETSRATRSRSHRAVTSSSDAAVGGDRRVRWIWIL